MSELFLSLLTDPLRIGLCLALVYTMRRTRAQTGTWLPLALGVAFLAVMLPVTRGVMGAPLLPAILGGALVNAIWVAVALAGFAVWDRRGR